VALKVVVLPFAVGFAEMLPHCAAPHDAIQLTPMPDESPVTIAVKGAVPVAMTEFEPAETATMMLGVMADELPPQLVMTIVEASNRTVGAKETPFMCASEVSIKTDAIR